MSNTKLRWRLWPWIVLLAVLVGAFYYESYLDSTILYYYVGVEIILLVVVVCWAWILSANHIEKCFKESFHKCFNSYLTCFVLVVLLTTVVSYLWGMGCIHVYCEGSRTFFLSNRWEDIIGGGLVAPLVEEPIYRLLPFVVASIPAAFIVSKKWRIVIAVVSILVILCVQVQFGYVHYSYIYETPDWLLKHIIFQGTTGVFFAMAYGFVLFLSYNTFSEKSNHAISIRPLVISHVLAFAASSLVHGFTNISIILSLTF